MGAMAVSCQKEDNNADAILVTKIITTDTIKGETTSLYEYDGRKIKTITETSDFGTTVFTYTYTGDDISKIVQSNEDGIVKSQSFIHAGGKLLMWSENFETDSDSCFFCETVATVDYNEDGSQTVKYYENYNTPDRTLKKTVNVSILNFTQWTEITELDLDGNKSVFTYKNGKANPHKNIIGWNYLVRIDPYLYAEGNIDGFIRFIDNEEWASGGHIRYKYNSNDFPMSCTTHPDNLYQYSKEYFYNK